jgi:hypothetical protein
MRARLLLSLLVLGPSSRQDELLFAVPPGTVLERTLEKHFTLTLGNVGLALDGEEVPPEALGSYEMRIEHSERFVIKDTIEALDAGAPTSLTRSFEELGGRETRAMSEGGAPPAREESQLESELEGRTVRFSRDAGGGEAVARWADGREGGTEWLTELREDLDLRAFLPSTPVVVGDAWELDVRAFQSVLEPGGVLGLREPGTERAASATLDAALREHLTGTLRASWLDVLESDGQRLARIALVLEARTHAEAELAPADLPPDARGQNRSDVCFRLAGELRWDLGHGHVSALDLAGEYEVKSAQSLRGELEGQPYEQEQTMDFGGEIRFSTRVERR